MHIFFYGKLKRSFNHWYNQMIFTGRKVHIDRNFNINGIIFVRNNGTITIGERFKANSGKRNNPIGGDTILRLITTKNAEIIIGNNCGISNSTIYAHNKISIGNNVLIGGGCKIWDSDFHSLNPVHRNSEKDNDIKSLAIHIKDEAFIGGGTIILKGVTIGRRSIVAAGSIVSKSVPDEEIWGGNPAKFIKKLPGYTRNKPYNIWH